MNLKKFKMELYSYLNDTYNGPFIMDQIRKLIFLISTNLYYMDYHPKYSKLEILFMDTEDLLIDMERKLANSR